MLHGSERLGGVEVLHRQVLAWRPAKQPPAARDGILFRGYTCVPAIALRGPAVAAAMAVAARQ